LNFLKNWFIIRKEIRKNLLKWIQKQKTTILIKKSLKKNLKKLKQKPDKKCFKQKKLETKKASLFLLSFFCQAFV
jgi:hypothetical protein